MVLELEFDVIDGIDDIELLSVGLVEISTVNFTQGPPH